MSVHLPTPIYVLLGTKKGASHCHERDWSLGDFQRFFSQDLEDPWSWHPKWLGTVVCSPNWRYEWGLHTISIYFILRCWVIWEGPPAKEFLFPLIIFDNDAHAFWEVARWQLSFSGDGLADWNSRSASEETSANRQLATMRVHMSTSKVMCFASLGLKVDV